MPRKKLDDAGEIADNANVAMQSDPKVKRALDALFKAFGTDADTAQDIVRRLDRVVQALVVGSIDKVKSEVILKTVSMQIELLAPQVKTDETEALPKDLMDKLSQALGVDPPAPIEANAA